jgi:hypothetical protein
MIIIEKNEGAKIPYSVSGTKVTFNDDLTINLASREQDWPVHIDICYDEDRALVIGAAAGRAYVAEIDIPARQYTEDEVDGETQRVPVPLNMDIVTLTLWSIE